LQRARANWVDGVCITGGEPTLQGKIMETADFIKKQGLDLKIDTQGSKPDVLSHLLDFCDYVAMDYKMPIEQYPSLIGVSVDAGKIKKSLSLLKEKASAYEIRTTVIPGIHTEEVIQTMCVELEGISPLSPEIIYRMKHCGSRKKHPLNSWSITPLSAAIILKPLLFGRALSLVLKVLFGKNQSDKNASRKGSLSSRFFLVPKLLVGLGTPLREKLRFAGGYGVCKFLGMPARLINVLHRLRTFSQNGILLLSFS
jgi:hypothetical protein